MMNSGNEIRRKTEIQRYYDAYKNKSYYMKPGRQENLRNYLQMRDFTTMIDVGCGRGESLVVASREDIQATGCEVVEYLCNEKVTWIEGAHDLSYVPVDYEENELVTSLDVMEHLLEEDVILAIQEMWRCASRCIFLGISTRSSSYHITVHDSYWWFEKIKEAIGKAPTMLELQKIGNYVYFEVMK